MHSRFFGTAQVGALAVAGWVLWAAGANVALRAAPAGGGQTGLPPVTHVTADRNSAESTLRSFLDAIGKGDTVTALSCVQGAKPSVFAEKVVLLMRVSRIEFLPSDMKSTAADDGVTIDYTFAARMPPQGARQADPKDAGDTAQDQVKLVKEGDNWVIVPGDPTKLNSVPPLFPSTFATMFAHPEATANSPMAQLLAKSAARAKASSCVSNMKQIGLAVLQYVEDWDEKYPPSAATYKKAVMPYIRSEKAFVCPETGKPYTFNKAMEKKTLSAVFSPADTVLIYEGTDGHLAFVHDGAAVVGFVDGHARLITPEAAKKLRWKP